MARQTNEEQARAFALAEWDKLSAKQRTSLFRGNGGGPLDRTQQALVRRGLLRVSACETFGDGYYNRHRTGWGDYVAQVGREEIIAEDEG